MIKKFIADLHVHSVLSPCAEIEMTPRQIVMYAAALGLNIVAITDHNASQNVPAAIRAARDYGITIIPGMEVQTQEEIHIVALFPHMQALDQWQAVVDRKLPDIRNNDKLFGAQLIVDEQDELIAVEEKMLLTSLHMSLEETVAQVEQLGGICIAAHVNRPAYSVFSQLGFIPEGVHFTALEVSARLKKPEHMRAQYAKYPLVVSSDAHRLCDLLSPKTWFYIKEPTFEEILLALQGKGGRKVEMEIV